MANTSRFVIALLSLTLMTHRAGAKSPDENDAYRKFESALSANASFGPTVAGTIATLSGGNTDLELISTAQGLASAIQARLQNSAFAVGNLTASPTGTAQAAPPLASPAQTEAVFEIRRAPNGTVRQLREPRSKSNGGGAQPASVAVSDEQIARAFLRRMRDSLGLTDPDGELALAEITVDEIGWRHLRFRQQFKELAVWPDSLSVHLNSNRAVEIVDGAYVPTPDRVDLTPTVESAVAVTAVKLKVPLGMTGSNSVPELIIFAPLESSPALAWRFRIIVGLLPSWEAVVDAHTGRVLLLQSSQREGRVSGSGKDHFGVTRAMTVWSSGGRFHLADTSKPSFQPAFDPLADPHGVITIYDLAGGQFPKGSASRVTSLSATSWSTGDAVSASYLLSGTYDYFYLRHRRNGIDGKGGNLRAVVRHGELDNAYYNQESDMMVFGMVKPYVGALDIVAHELTHGVTGASAGLVYRNEAGALNESFSDIFGEMVEANIRGQNDWIIGSDLGTPVRNLKAPGELTIGGTSRRYPQKISEMILPQDPLLDGFQSRDNGGVHLNSSIINHAFYLLAEGLPGAIGTHDAEGIFFRALVYHLQPQSQFIDGRLAFVVSARELFGADSIQAEKVAAAFDSVEIFDRPPTTEPGNLPAVAAADSVIIVYNNKANNHWVLGRRENAKGDPSYGKDLYSGVAFRRPAISGDGEVVVFVSEDNGLSLGTTANLGQDVESLGFSGQVNSIAITPNASRMAFVFRDQKTGQSIKKIVTVDTSTKQSRVFDLVSPSIDGVSVDTILRADQLAFSPDGRFLVYDALSQVKFDGGAPVDRWSIYSIDIDAAVTRVVVPPLEGYNVGNPAFGHTGNRFLVFEGNEITTGDSVLVTYDLFKGSFGNVGFVKGSFGYPDFTGDDLSVIYSAPDTSASLSGFSLMQQRLLPDRITKLGITSKWLFDARLGVTYRRGQYRGTNPPPQLVVLQPKDGAVVTTGSSVTFSVSATDSDGVAKVEFYNGSAKVGETSTFPFAFTWNSVPAGNHDLVARAVDSLGATTDSPVIHLRATTAQSPSISATLSLDRIVLKFTGVPGVYHVDQSSDLLNWQPLRDVTIPVSGSASINGPTSDRGLFLRVHIP